MEDISSYILTPGDELPVLEFKEIWAYVVAGRESSVVKDLPITDIAYFGAEVDSYGKICDVPRRSGIPSHFTGRVHLVIACSSRSLTHFVLKPGSDERKEYIADIITATKNFDGINIDLEYVPQRGSDAFITFIQELREGLTKDKMLTICVPARTRKLETDIYDYDRITPLVDRVFVMAYDEHWSGSRPGSVASLAWCRRVAEYSVNAIGQEKLIMGLPFYGRAWGDYNPSRALIYTTIENIIKDEHVKDIRYESGIPYFEYEKNVKVRVFFEDEYSLVSRMNMYKTMGIDSVGFWRLGQETAEVWKHLKITADISIPINTKITHATIFTPNSTTTIAVAAPPAAPVNDRYTVKKGDSLWAISKKYGITPQALADLNGMNLNDTLYIGRVLRVPTR